MEYDDPVGGKVIGIWHRQLTWAVENLLVLGTEQLRHLKVRSGEHLAAILTTAFIGAAPSSIDVDGGVDLSFDRESITRPFGPRSGCPATFEVKSMPGPFREIESRIERLTRSGQDASGLGVTVTVQGADDILIEARPLLATAATRLKTKVADSRALDIGADVGRRASV